MKPPPDQSHENESAYVKFTKRWERKYAIQLALEKVFDFLSRHKKAVLGTLLVALFAVGLYHLEIWTDYDQVFSGYRLVAEDYPHWQATLFSDTIYATESVTLQLRGRICHRLFRRPYFCGQIQMAEYHNPNDFGYRWDTTIQLPYEWEECYRARVWLENDAGEYLHEVFIRPGDAYRFCFWDLTEMRSPELDGYLAAYYLFPATTEEEAVDLFLHRYKPVWVAHWEKYT